MLPAATATILVVVMMMVMLMIAIRPVLMATAARRVIVIRTALPARQNHKDESDEQHEN